MGWGRCHTSPLHTCDTGWGLGRCRCRTLHCTRSTPRRPPRPSRSALLGTCTTPKPGLLMQHTQCMQWQSRHRRHSRQRKGCRIPRAPPGRRRTRCCTPGTGWPRAHCTHRSQRHTGSTPPLSQRPCLPLATQPHRPCKSLGQSRRRRRRRTRCTSHHSPGRCQTSRWRKRCKRQLPAQSRQHRRGGTRGTPGHPQRCLSTPQWRRRRCMLWPIQHRCHTHHRSGST